MHPFSKSISTGARGWLLSLLAGAVGVVLPATARAQDLLSDFETEEGFAPGAVVTGEGGWAGSGSAFVVSNARAFSGAQSLSVSPQPSSITRTFGEDKRYTQVAFYFCNPDAAFSAGASLIRFRVNLGLGASMTAQSVMEFTIDYGSAPDAPLGLTYRFQTFSGGGRVNDTNGRVPLPRTASSQFHDWTLLSLNVDAAEQKVFVTLGDRQLAALPLEAEPGPHISPEAGLYQLQFWGHTAESPAFYDRVTATEAP